MHLSLHQRYSKGNANVDPPVAVITCDRTDGSIPLTITCSAKLSYDPQKSSLRYNWNFNVTNHDNTATFTYSEPGVFSSQLIVINAYGISSAPAIIKITAGNTSPIPIITSVGVGHKFWSVGDKLSFSG